jgi:competence ComEA-like helix-hairpin-helix protein
MTGDERKALSFVAILLGLSAVARAVNRPEPIVVAGATAVDIQTRLEQNQQVRERISRPVRTPAQRPAKPVKPATAPTKTVTIDNREIKSRQHTPLNVNRATVAELDALPGVSPAVAQRIVEYREMKGLIEGFEQLDSIKGIGPALLARLTPLLKFR